MRHHFTHLNGCYTDKRIPLKSKQPANEKTSMRAVLILFES